MKKGNSGSDLQQLRLHKPKGKANRPVLSGRSTHLLFFARFAGRRVGHKIPTRPPPSILNSFITGSGQ